MNDTTEILRNLPLEVFEAPRPNDAWECCPLAGVSDGILVQSVAAAITALRGRLGPMVKIEIEVDTLAQLEEALAAGAEAILLDNMPPDLMKRAVAITNGRATLEASGGVTRERVRAIAESGVDFISSGALTHSARALDLGLDFL